MERDKIKVFIFEVMLIFILFFALFMPNIFTRNVLSLIISIYAIIVYKNLKKRKIISIYKNQVILLMFIFSLVYLGVFYLLGLYFGFVKAKVLFSMWSIFRFIIPLTIIIISSEIIRNIFLSNYLSFTIKSKKFELSSTFTFISMLLVDILIYTGVYDLGNIDDFLVALGFVLFASISCNLLYNYISIRYGHKGIVIYRLITILFVYFIPVIPDMYIFFRSFLRMIYPYIIYIILEKLYSKNEFVVAYKDKKKELFFNTLLITVTTLVIMLISCQFKFGILVIGSRSMSGTLNKGDAIIYEKYNNGTLNQGEVILFEYNGMQTIHRIVDIKNVNGEYRYYTKGDANSSMDDGYRIKNNIIGLVKIRIKYVGYPTLWMRELFS